LHNVCSTLLRSSRIFYFLPFMMIVSGKQKMAMFSVQKYLVLFHNYPKNHLN
jgi:hypothetical protein